jgi:hypothetical protein
MTRVEWNLSDGAPLSCRRRARLEKIGCIGRRLLIVILLAMCDCGELVLPPSYRQRPHSDTETQRPSQSARGLMRLCLTATKLKIAVRIVWPRWRPARHHHAAGQDLLQ